MLQDYDGPTIDKVIDIIQNEEEFDGDLPDGPYKLHLESILRNQDMNKLVAELRQAVRLTKSCLITKVEALR